MFHSILFSRRAFSTLYRPLKEYKGTFNAFQKVFSQQQRNEFEYALKLYTSHDDISQFSQKEMKQIFPALLAIGKLYTIYENNPNEASKWFSHAMIFGEKAGPMTDLAPDYVEMTNFFSDINQPDPISKFCNRASKILPTLPPFEIVGHEPMIEKGRKLFSRGCVLRVRGDINEALEALGRSLEIFEGLGDLKDSQKVLIDLYELLANTYYQRMDLSKAYMYSMKGLDLIDKTLGLDNIRGNYLAKELACTFTKQGRCEGALFYVKKWENILKKEYGENDPKMIYCYFLHGQICVSLGIYAEASKVFQKLEEILRNNKDFKFHDFEEILLERAHCQWIYKNHKEARECFTQAIEYNKKKFGAESKNVADCIFSGAKSLAYFPELNDETLEYVLQALEIYRKNGPTCNFEIVSMIDRFRHFLIQNYPNETIKILPEAIGICRNSFPENKEIIEEFHSCLGTAHLELEDFQNATENFEAAVKICEETGNASRRLYLHYWNLASVHRQNEQYEKAEEYGKKASELQLEEEKQRRLWTDDLFYN